MAGCKRWLGTKQTNRDRALWVGEYHGWIKGYLGTKERLYSLGLGVTWLYAFVKIHETVN